MPFALMEILPRFGWTKSPNAARGERWVDCSLFFVVALLVISSLLLDLPVPPRFANAFAPVVLMREMTDFPPLPLSPAGGLFLLRFPVSVKLFLNCHLARLPEIWSLLNPRLMLWLMCIFMEACFVMLAVFIRRIRVSECQFRVGKFNVGQCR